MPSARLIERSESPRCWRRWTSYASRRRTSLSIAEAALALDRLELLGGASPGAERPMHERTEHARLVRRQPPRRMSAPAAREIARHTLPAPKQPPPLVAPLAQPRIRRRNGFGLVRADKAQRIGEHLVTSGRIVALL